MNLKLKHVIIILNSFVFLCTFIFQNFLLILKDFYAFFQLSKILGRVLDEINIFITSRFHLFVQGLKMLQFVSCLFILLCQIKNKKFFDFELFSSLANLCSCSRGLSGHRLTYTCRIFYLFLNVVDHSLQFRQISLHFSNFSLDLFLFTLITYSFILNHSSFISYNSSILFDFFLTRLLLSHFCS